MLNLLYLYKKYTIYVNYLQIYEMDGTYHIENTLMSFHVHLFRNSCCFDSKLISSALSIEPFMVLAGVFLKYLIFWNVALCLLPSSPDIFKCRRGLLFRGKESRTNFLRHGSSTLILLTIFWKHLADESGHRKVTTYRRKYN